MAGEVLDMMEQDLGTTIENDFASPCSMVDPNGNVITVSANGGPLYARFTDDYVSAGESGEAIIIKDPMIIMRISSLSRVPVGGEKWSFCNLRTGKLYVIDGNTKVPERADSIGFIRLYPRQVAQL
jgi:hypothetical protein